VRHVQTPFPGVSGSSVRRRLRCSGAKFLLATIVASSTCAAAGQPFTLAQSLLATNAEPGARHGFSVGVDNRTAVVGALYDSLTGRDSGGARIYDTITGDLQHTLSDPTPEDFANFGAAVAISGSYVVVGAPQKNTGAPGAGGAYLYNLASAQPTVPVFTLKNPAPATNDYFGNAVAISGSRVVVGSPYDVGEAQAGGRVFLYDLASSNPMTPTSILGNPSGFFSDEFGMCVGISGNRVVVGAPRDSSEGFGPGRAYVYDLAAASPGLSFLILTNPTPEMADSFGWSVAISGAYAVVGAPFDDTGAQDAGSVYVYDLTKGLSPANLVTLTNPAARRFDNFGWSVALSGTRLVVGCDGSSPNSGTAYVYDLASATPRSPIVTLKRPNSAVDDSFGSAVAVADTTIVVGAPYNNSDGQARGAAYAFVVGPMLRLTRTDAGTASLSWTPANAPGFVLQWSQSSEPESWMNAATTTNPVTVPLTNAVRFYRMQSQ